MFTAGIEALVILLPTLLKGLRFYSWGMSIIEAKVDDVVGIVL